MEYTLVTNSDEHKFIKKVNDMIADGWEPFGSVNVTSTGQFYVYFVQPMIKTTR